MVVALFAATGARAQLITNGQAIPDNGKPPVVFLNGYQNGCSDRGSFTGTFGIADQLVQRDGRVSLFFNNCDVPGNPEIEELGNAFRDFLNGLKYTDGRAVPQVDVVAHSMGGIIVRCYLTGKQRARGVFLAPADVKIRKAVFLAAPFFGSLAANLSAPDVQSQELLPGSIMLFDLATWNQGRDDLRGIDAVAVVAAGGTGVLNLRPGFDDSTVTLTSGSLDFAQPDRTRVVSGYCHTTLSGILAVACTNPSNAVARMTDDQHPSAKVMMSFLSGTTDWRTVGQAPAQADYLKDHAGVQLQLRDAQDAVVPITSASPNLNIRSGEIVWTDYTQAPVTPFEAVLGVPSAQATVRIATVVPGDTQAVIVPTAGPTIGAVVPNFSDVSPRAVAPGSFISIYGGSLSGSTAVAPGGSPYPSALGGAEVALNNQPIAIQYASPTQINAVVPDNATGVVRLEVRSPSGKRGLNLLVEAAVPSLFQTAVIAATGALITTDAPAHRGDYISIYLTGLGATDRRADGLDWARIQPTVTVGGTTCSVSYAGRAPGFVGLDQINCQIGQDAALSDTAAAVVRSGSRSQSIRVPTR